MVDILDKLQNVDGYVRLVLSTGEIVYGHPDCIVYEEDDEGWDTIKQLRFEPWCEQFARYFGLGEIESYEECSEDDIPPSE